MAGLHKKAHRGGEVDDTGSWSFQAVNFGVKPCCTIGFCSREITDGKWSTPHTCKDPWQPWLSAAAVQIAHGEGTGKYSHCEGGSGWRHEESDLRNYHNLLLWPQPQTPKLFFPHTDMCGLQTDIQLPVHISHAYIAFGLTHLGIFYLYWWQHASPDLNEIIKAKGWDWWDICYVWERLETNTKCWSECLKRSSILYDLVIDSSIILNRSS